MLLTKLLHSYNSLHLHCYLSHFFFLPHQMHMNILRLYFYTCCTGTVSNLHVLNSGLNWCQNSIQALCGPFTAPRSMPHHTLNCLASHLSIYMHQKNIPLRIYVHAPKNIPLDVNATQILNQFPNSLEMHGVYTGLKIGIYYYKYICIYHCNAGLYNTLHKVL